MTVTDLSGWLYLAQQTLLNKMLRPLLAHQDLGVNFPLLMPTMSTVVPILMPVMMPILVFEHILRHFGLYIQLPHK